MGSAKWRRSSKNTCTVRVRVRKRQTYAEVSYAYIERNYLPSLAGSTPWTAKVCMLREPAWERLIWGHILPIHWTLRALHFFYL
jgi:hypothetical protein